MAIENQSNKFLIECAWKKAQCLFLRINKHTEGFPIKFMQWHFVCNLNGTFQITCYFAYKFYLTFFKVFLSLILLTVTYNLELQS